jgi:uncharacterized RDD family membrane protein YckC
MDKYETFGRRIIAAILDSLIFIPIGIGVPIFFFIVGINPGLLGSAIAGLISAFYYILMHYYRGQTLGKMVMKVKVLDDSETPLNFGQAIVRSLPQLLIPMFAISFSTADRAAYEDSIAFWASLVYVFTILFFFANVLVCLASDKKRALHDFLAGTIVVRTDV